MFDVLPVIFRQLESKRESYRNFKPNLTFYLGGEKEKGEAVEKSERKRAAKKTGG